MGSYMWKILDWGSGVGWVVGGDVSRGGVGEEGRRKRSCPI